MSGKLIDSDKLVRLIRLYDERVKTADSLMQSDITTLMTESVRAVDYDEGYVLELDSSILARLIELEEKVASLEEIVARLEQELSANKESMISTTNNITNNL